MPTLTVKTPLLKRDSNMQRRVGTDSGYETSSARHERARDLGYNDSKLYGTEPWSQNKTLIS